MRDRSRWFVSTAWLAGHLADPDVVVVDGTWHLPGAGRDARAEYETGHIPGAVFFDIDAIADTTNPLPHMLPTVETFVTAVSALGIDERQKIVCYDGIGMFSAPRVWWTFQVMGAKDVVLLEGGLPRWKAEGRELEAGTVTRPPRTFNATPAKYPVRDLNEVRDGIAAGAFQLVDARPAARFRGEAPEPRSWVKSGHVPGSHNVPASELLVDGQLKDAAALRAAFAAGGVDLARPVVTSCGSGVNAAILSVALETLGVKPAGLYDGSWTEWGGRSDTAIATGT
jgi:thiosulfate/3-mercaptopyruvate sulfurtransferase